MDAVIKIAVVGPESTGKSTMAAYLAKHYHTVWVPEFAREYCARLTGKPTWQDEVNMFHGQLALEKELIPKANKLLICDTTFITVKIWSDHTFNRTPQEVLDELPKHTYDLYLLLNIDVAWEADPLRDFPHQRGHFMNIWYRELEALQANYVLISGVGEQRYFAATAAVDKFLAAKNTPGQ